jgi:hypothetical protein
MTHGLKETRIEKKKKKEPSVFFSIRGWPMNDAQIERDTDREEEKKEPSVFFSIRELPMNDARMDKERG